MEKENVVYPETDVFSVSNDHRYYLEMELGDERKIRTLAEQPTQSFVVDVEESKSYMIHVTDKENIIFVCHKNYDSRKEFKNTAFVVVKCYQSTKTAEYTMEGDEFILIVAPDHEIQVIRTEDAFRQHEEMKSEKYDVGSGEMITFKQKSRTQYYFTGVKHVNEDILSHPGMVNLTVEGQMRDNDEYQHYPKSNYIYTKTGHTYTLSLTAKSEVRVQHQMNDENSSRNSLYTLNIVIGNEYRLFVQPNEVYLLIGSSGFEDEEVDEEGQTAKVVVKCVKSNEERTLILDVNDVFTTFTTPNLTLHLIYTGSVKEDITKGVIQIKKTLLSGHEYKTNVRKNFCHTITGQIPENNSAVSNPAVVYLTCEADVIIPYMLELDPQVKKRNWAAL